MQTGALVATTAASTASSQPFVGRVADKIGARRVAGVGAVLSSALLALVGVSPSLWLVFVMILVGGLGSAAYHPAAAVLARRVLPQRAPAGRCFMGHAARSRRSLPGRRRCRRPRDRLGRQPCRSGPDRVCLADLGCADPDVDARSRARVYRTFAAALGAGVLVNAAGPLIVVAAQEHAPHAVAAASGVVMGLAGGAAGFAFIGIGAVADAVGLRVVSVSASSPLCPHP